MKNPPPIKLTTRFKGEFNVRVRSADGELLRETGFFPNLILDNGLDRIASGSSVGQYCRIGTGNTAPANSDVALVSQSASTSSGVQTSNANAGSPDYETENTTTYTFTLGAVVGNMAEVGIGWTAATSGTLFSRALIVDGLGAPTTITVLVTEVLEVVYRLTYFPILTDETGTISISSVSYDYTARVAECDQARFIGPLYAWLGSIISVTPYNGAIGAVTASPSGTASTLSAGSFATYTNGTYYRDFTISGSLSEGNLAGGIMSIRIALGGVSTVFMSQIEFDPPIPKDNTKVFSMTLRQAWARH